MKELWDEVYFLYAGRLVSTCISTSRYYHLLVGLVKANQIANQIEDFLERQYLKKDLVNCLDFYLDFYRYKNLPQSC